MNIIIWLVVGGLIGWAASAVMRTREGMLLNVVVGIVGAALGGWFLIPRACSLPRSPGPPCCSPHPTHSATRAIAGAIRSERSGGRTKPVYVCARTCALGPRTLCVLNRWPAEPVSTVHPVEN